MTVELMEEVPEHGNKAKFVFQQGLTGSTLFPANKHETAPPTRRGTRMTRIERISTDPRASASSARSAFHRRSSAFVCVYLRLIFASLSNKIWKTKFKLFPIINEKINNELRPAQYELTKPEFVSVRISWLFSPYFISFSFINQGIWRDL
jgi:hypothetical protein